MCTPDRSCLVICNLIVCQRVKFSIMHEISVVVVVNGDGDNGRTRGGVRIKVIPATNWRVIVKLNLKLVIANYSRTNKISKKR